MGPRVCEGTVPADVGSSGGEGDGQASSTPCVPFIGVPRAAVRAHIAARDRRRQPAMPDGVGVRPDDFYAFQVFGPAVQAVAVA